MKYDRYGKSGDEWRLQIPAEREEYPSCDHHRPRQPDGVPGGRCIRTVSNFTPWHFHHSLSVTCHEKRGCRNETCRRDTYRWITNALPPDIGPRKIASIAWARRAFKSFLAEFPVRYMYICVYIYIYIYIYMCEFVKPEKTIFPVFLHVLFPSSAVRHD